MGLDGIITSMEVPGNLGVDVISCALHVFRRVPYIETGPIMDQMSQLRKGFRILLSPGIGGWPAFRNFGGKISLPPFSPGKRFNAAHRCFKEMGLQRGGEFSLFGFDLDSGKLRKAFKLRPEQTFQVAEGMAGHRGFSRLHDLLPAGPRRRITP